MSKKKDDGSPFAKLRELRDKMAADERTKSAGHGQKAGQNTSRSASPSAGRGPGSAPKAEPVRATEPRDALGRSSADEDAFAFHRLVTGVKPLDAAAKTRLPRVDGGTARGEVERAAGERLRAVEQREASEVHEHLRQLVEGGARFEVQDDGRRVEGYRVDVPAEVVRKLRRGTLPIDARLDLHGLHAQDAREALAGFLRTQRARGERCVLVVHGKGHNSPGGVGVLRGEIAAWLSQTGASDSVAAFATAADDDGGEGAVYVLLRR